MRLAYADPPYLGMGKLYADRHPEAHVWDDPETHRDLIESLSNFDGWALSVSTPSLPVLLPMCPPGVRIASWVKPFAAFKRNVRIAYTWEPVIFVPGRDSSKDGAPVGRDHLAEPITMLKGFPGAKPERFCSWVLDLLGWTPSDELVDLYPGTGVMGRVVAASSRHYGCRRTHPLRGDRMNATPPPRALSTVFEDMARFLLTRGWPAEQIQARYPNQPIEKIRAIQQELATAAAATRPAGGDQSLSTRA